MVKIALLGGRGSEKLWNFHHLQMMKSMEGGGSQSKILLPQHQKDGDISNVSQISVCLPVCYYISNSRITM